jgi:hypothetical protein
MIIQVKVSAKASKNSVEGFEGEVLKVKCTAVPEGGKANEAVVALLAKHYGVSKSRVTIIRGITSSTKTVEIN